MSITPLFLFKCALAVSAGWMLIPLIIYGAVALVAVVAALFS